MPLASELALHAERAIGASEVGVMEVEGERAVDPVAVQEDVELREADVRISLFVHVPERTVRFDRGVAAVELDEGEYDDVVGVVA